MTGPSLVSAFPTTGEAAHSSSKLSQRRSVRQTNCLDVFALELSGSRSRSLCVANGRVALNRSFVGASLIRLKFAQLLPFAMPDSLGCARSRHSLSLLVNLAEELPVYALANE